MDCGIVLPGYPRRGRGDRYCRGLLSGTGSLPTARNLAPTRLKAQQAGEWPKDARRIRPQGYVGEPDAQNAEKARAYVTEWCRMMAESIAAYAVKSR